MSWGAAKKKLPPYSQSRLSTGGNSGSKQAVQETWLSWDFPKPWFSKCGWGLTQQQQLDAR